MPACEPGGFAVKANFANGEVKRARRSGRNYKAEALKADAK
jgi:hypothetical protein